MDKKQPEAQERKFWKRLCALNRFSFFYMGGGVARASDKSGNWIEVHSAQEIVDDAECELRRQHARITELESRLEAVGAGGVSGPLIGQPQAMPDLSQLTERGAKAWAGVDAQGLREGFTAADMATVSAQGFRDGVASVSTGSASMASYAARLLVAAALVTQAKADEALRFAEGLTAAHGPADGESNV